MSVRRIKRIRAFHMICACTAASLLSAPPSQAQEKLSFRIDDEVTRFAFSGDGRIVYAVPHVFSEKKIQLQRDDIWVADRDGKKRRILQGEKFVRGANPFSYLVRGLRWSPDGTKLTVDLATSEMINEGGDTRDGVMTLLLDENGGEIPVAGGDSVISGATNAAWLADEATIAYLTAAPPEERPPTSEIPPNKDTSYIVNRVQPAVGSGKPMNSAGKFAAVVWNPAKSSGVGIVRSPLMVPNIPDPIGPADLMALDFTKEAVRDGALLEGYAGGLSISPSGDMVAYWVSKEQLEVRDIGTPNRVTRVRVLLGTLGWAGDEKRVLVKQGAPNKSGSLVWILLPQLAPVAAGTTPETHNVALQSILHDLEFRQFDISPDGKSLAVVEPGRRNLLVYSLH
jgi:dipeptidyl aminopeptidase/acylaminoacyl peptidase